MCIFTKTTNKIKNQVNYKQFYNCITDTKRRCMTAANIANITFRGGVVAQWQGVGLVIKRSRVRSPAGRGCVTTLGKLFTPNLCLDADTLR